MQFYSGRHDPEPRGRPLSAGRVNLVRRIPGYFPRFTTKFYGIPAKLRQQRYADASIGMFSVSKPREQTRVSSYS